MGERLAVGEDERRVVEPCVAGRGWGGAQAFPGVEADVVVIAPRREKSRALAYARLDREAQHLGVEGYGAVEIGHLEMDMADAGLRRRK